ncbi:alpha/beta-hydrolase, partial [Meira miltonrushii]
MDSDQATSTKAKLASVSSRGGKQQARSTERPWLGGLYFTDIIFIAFTYSVNLLRTLGLAELADVIFKGLVYAFTRLPFELYRRWSLMIDQLSPFHHLVILLSRFACGNFPHLLPRVLFAEETIGPFVYWRTGGGSNAMSNNAQSKEADEKSFRAYLLSKDARLPIEVQRANLASRRATTLLYLHGGGFSLGSVAFYAEALLRLRAKIALLESDGPVDAENPAAEARCVAVEYDLSPAARFPQPLLQCLRCYAHLIEVEKIHPDSICLSGDSAGGNLAMAMLLCLDGQMRDEPLLAERDWSTLPMPGKAVLISPWVDLPNAWTEAVAKYDWDFVAGETLLHFAQVYSGVLPLPRRVYGPLGFMNPFRALSALSRPSRKLARATHEALNDPLLPRLLGLNLIGTGVQSQSDTVSRYDSITAATRTRLHARQLLDTHPLLSPAIGDWSRIKLKHGCLITWGERERMAEDIESWVDSLVNQAQAIEKGPGGVHAWPFVSMYLAGSEGERERGLDLMARFV